MSDGICEAFVLLFIERLRAVTNEATRGKIGSLKKSTGECQPYKLWLQKVVLRWWYLYPCGYCVCLNGGVSGFTLRGI